MFCRCTIIAGLVCCIYCVMGCSSAKKTASHPEAPAVVVATPELKADSAKTDTFLEGLLAGNPALGQVLHQRKEWNTQVLYTQVNRGANGVPTLTHYYFNVNPADYFYPASTVKLPVSLLALQKLQELKEKVIDRNSTMITEADGPGQTAVYNDPTTPDGRPTVAHYIRKILLVSDNDAYNRLYEFLGQEYINTELHNKGYGDVQLLHRLQISLNSDENRQTNPVKFVDENNNSLYEQPAKKNTRQYAQRNDSLGTAFYQGKSLINGPMNFSGKNRISLEDLHTILISLVFPDKVTAKQRFNITENDRRFMLQYMSQYPAESTSPPYLSDTTRYWPASGKLLLFGSQKGDMPKNIRIFNKTGGAYGQLLDIAYIVDFEKGVEFFLSAVIYCNSDGVLNDDVYDYKTIGMPFMKNLGQTVYDYEVQRPKKYLPTLSDLRMQYDK